MKHAVKYIVGGAMVLVGIIFVLIACSIGGWQMLAEGPVFSFDTWSWIYNNEDVTGRVENVMEIKNLYIDIGTSDFHLEAGGGSDIDIRTENTKENCFRYEVDGDTLKISYNTKFLSIFSFGAGSKIYVTIPENIDFDTVKISNSVGMMTVSDINADNLILETGTGAGYFDNIKAGKIKVDSGVGEIKITNAVTDELDLDTGVGRTAYDGEINGDADIDSGVGEVVISIKGTPDDYRFNIDKGLGDVTLNGNSCSGSFGSGIHKFDTDRGVGAVRIDIAERKRRSYECKKTL